MCLVTRERERERYTVATVVYSRYYKTSINLNTSCYRKCSIFIYYLLIVTSLIPNNKILNFVDFWTFYWCTIYFEEFYKMQIYNRTRFFLWKYISIQILITIFGYMCFDAYTILYISQNTKVTYCIQCRWHLIIDEREPKKYINNAIKSKY